MTAKEALSRAASLICGPGAYSAKADGLACRATTRTFNASSALERSVRRLKSGAVFLGEPDRALLAEVKRRVCRVVGHPHLDLWEWIAKPDWREVRWAFERAAI